MKKTTLALVLSGIVSMNASAAGFFDTLDSALKGIENAAAKVAEQGNTPQLPNVTLKDNPQGEDILIKYRNKSTNLEIEYVNINGSRVLANTWCSNNNIDRYVRTYKNALNNDPKSAKFYSQSMVAFFAECATSAYPYIEGHTKQEFVHRTGDALSSLAIMTSDEVVKSDAEVLLNWYGTDTGQIAAMNKAFGLNAAVQDAAMLSANPYTLVDMRKRNNVSFDRRYEGKIIESVGVVTKIYGNDRSVVFSLKGSDKDKDNLSFSDYVVCNVTNKEEMLKADNFGIGQRVKVKGIYQKEIMGSINLNECGVRHAPKKG